MAMNRFAMLVETHPILHSLIAPSGGAGTLLINGIQNGNACPTGTSTVGWTIIPGNNSSYDPPQPFANKPMRPVNPRNTDCGVPTWANNCRKVTVLPLRNISKR
jgi:hypothetical protein